MKAGEGPLDRRQYHHRLPGTINCVVPGDVVNVGSPGTREAEAGPRRRAASPADTVEGTDPVRRTSRGGMESRGALCVWHLLAWWAFVNLELEIIHISRRQSSRWVFSPSRSLTGTNGIAPSLRITLQSSSLLGWESVLMERPTTGVLGIAAAPADHEPLDLQMTAPRQTAPAPPPLPMMEHTLLRKLAADAERTDAELDGISRLLTAAAERQREKDALCASLAEDLGGQHAQLAEMREKLAESQALRAREAALAHSAHAGKASLESTQRSLEAELRHAHEQLEAEKCRVAALQGTSQAAQERLAKQAEQARLELEARLVERSTESAASAAQASGLERALADALAAHGRELSELKAAHQHELQTLRSALSSRDDEVAELVAASRRHEEQATQAARELLGLTSVLHAKDHDLERLQRELGCSEAACQAASSARAALAEQVAALEAQCAALERTGQAQATSVAQEKALALGARLKHEKLAADIRRESERADAAERALAEANERARAAADMASRAEAGGASMASEAQSVAERADAERKRAEARAQRLQSELEAARATCEAARDECVKVRRRCESAEKALAELRERFGVSEGEDDAAAGGGANGLGQIFDNLSEMESMVLADSKEAERRLRARAKRANAHEVVGRMDETEMGLS